MLGVAILGALAASERARRDSRVPISSFAKAHSLSRDFMGVCQNEYVEFTCDDHRFKVPLDRINILKAEIPLFASNIKYKIELIDGSKYLAEEMNTDEFVFISVAGRQAIPTLQGKVVERSFLGFKSTDDQRRRHPFSIEGAVPEDLALVRRRLEHAISQNAKVIISEIGSELFGQYFLLE